MALYTGRLLMRGGNEADFDADKMMPREWAVSTDKKIVRICVAPGVVIRMATYDAFEEDMAKIENILKECQTIQEVVVRINTEVSKNADAVAEYTSQAKTYMESAKVSATNAKTSETNAKTSEVNAKASETNAKVSEEKAQAVFESLPEDYGTLSKEFYEVAIKQKASGENIHVTDSANAKVREFALFGKAKQETTSGKNLLEYPYRSTTTHINGIDWVDNRDGTITGNGTCTKIESLFNFFENSNAIPQYIQKGILYTCSIGGTSTSVNMEIFEYVDDKWVKIVTTKKKANFSISDNATGLIIRLQVYQIGTIVNNVTVYPMIRLASITDDTYEPFTNGASPNPQYPQPIEVSGESGSVAVKSCGKNKVKNELIDYSKYGLNYHVNDDKSISISGTNTFDGTVVSNEFGYTLLKKGTYILNGCKDGSTSTHRLNVYDRNKKLLAQQLNEDVTFIIEEEKEVYLAIAVSKGKTIDTILYPMISIEGGEYEPYKETTATFPTPNGLCGIKVSSNGNYTDQNGQQWICDEVVKYADGSGEKIRNIVNCKLADLSWTYTGNEGERRFVSSDLVGVIKEQKDSNSLPIALCDSYRVLSYADCYGKYTDKTMTVIFESSGLHGQLWIINTDFDNVDDFKNSLGDTLFYYQLKEPIITPLTSEEISEIEKLSTFYPVTNISNDADCGMKVTYLCDSKNYIDSKIAELATAMVNNI